MSKIRLASAGILGTGALLAVVSSASAVTPVLSCVAPRTGGLTAYFGYSNPAAAPRVIGIGPNNRFQPAPSDRGQPVEFAPDTPAQPGFADTRRHIYMGVDFTGTLTWRLDGSTAVASAASPACNFDLGIAVTPDRATARPGDDVVWSVAVRNTGTSPVRRDQIVFTTVDLPPLSIAGSPPDELLAGEVLTYRGLTRPAADSCGQTVTAAGDVVMGPGPVDTRESSLLNNHASSSFTVTCVSDLAISAATDATTFSPGQSATYTLTVTNTGDVPVPTAGIAVTDPTLTGLVPVGVAPATLAPQAALTYRGSRAISADMCTTGTSNQASVAFTGTALTDANPANNTASRPVTVSGGACSASTVNPNPVQVADVPAATLAVSSVGRARVRVGGLGTYLITVRNTSDTIATGVVVSGYTPSGASLTQRPQGATLLNGRALWRLGDLAPGASRTLRLAVRFGRSAPGRRVASAIAAAQNASTVRAAFNVRVLPRPAVRQRPQPAVTG